MITEFATIKANSKTVSGFNPVTFRFKQNICDEKGLIPVTSFIGYLTVSYWASDCFSTTYYSPAFRFTLQHTLNDFISLGYNLGAEWNGESAEPEFIYNLTTGISISKKAGAYVEVYG